MDETRQRNRALVREIRRGLFVIKQGLEAWKAREPDPRNAALARAICVLILGMTKALAAWSGDGEVVPGDSRTVERTHNRPPVTFDPQ